MVSYTQSKKYSQRGVTLVEVGVVLVIMALLVAGITSAQHLIESAKIRSATKEIENHSSALASFTDQFKLFPGDMPTFTTFYPAATNPTSANGDGDGRIEYTGGAVTSHEGNLAWAQMSLVGLVTGDFQATNDDDILDINIPRSNAAGGGAGFTLDFTAALGNQLIYGLADGSGNIDTAIFTPNFASRIDSKLDDGHADSGLIRSDGLAACTASGNYDFASEEIACYLRMRLD
jgi:type II secretory pathway pseudopilin PulG